MGTIFKLFLLIGFFTVLNVLGQTGPKAHSKFIVHLSDLKSYRSVINLTGKGISVSGAKIVSYSWRQISGSAVGLRFPEWRITPVHFVNVGDYAFEFTVTDVNGLKGYDTAFVKVIN